MIIAPDGFVLDRGVLVPDAPERPEPMRTVAICPGADVSIRWLDLPPGGAAQLRAAAAWRLRDDLAATPDRVATVVGPPAGPDQPRLVATVSHGLLQAWSDYLEALGVHADVLTPDMLALSEPEEEDVVLAVTFGENTALRGRRFAVTVQPDLVDLVVGARRIVLHDEDMVERALVQAAQSPVINLFDNGARDRTAARVGWRRAAGLAAALAVSPLLLIAATAARDDIAARRLETEAVAAIAAVAPDLAREPDPVTALRRRTAAAPPPGGVTAAAAALFAAVEGIEGVEIDAFLAAPGDGVRATLSHPAYSDMQELDRRMADAGLAVTENATLDDGGRVVSDISIGARP
jgi:general secretion pathway protein L